MPSSPNRFRPNLEEMHPRATPSASSAHEVHSWEVQARIQGTLTPQAPEADDLVELRQAGSDHTEEGFEFSPLDGTIEVGAEPTMEVTENADGSCVIHFENLPMGVMAFVETEEGLKVRALQPGSDNLYTHEETLTLMYKDKTMKLHVHDLLGHGRKKIMHSNEFERYELGEALAKAKELLDEYQKEEEEKKFEQEQHNHHPGHVFHGVHVGGHDDEHHQNHKDNHKEHHHSNDHAHYDDHVTFAETQLHEREEVLRDLTIPSIRQWYREHMGFTEADFQRLENEVHALREYVEEEHKRALATVNGNGHGHGHENGKHATLNGNGNGNGNGHGYDSAHHHVELAPMPREARRPEQHTTDDDNEDGGIDFNAVSVDQPVEAANAQTNTTRLKIAGIMTLVAASAVATQVVDLESDDERKKRSVTL